MTTSARNPVIAAVLVLCAWQLATMTGLLQFYVLPRPTAVAAAMVDHASVLERHGRATLTVAVVGFLLGVGSAVLVAMALTYSRLARAAFYPGLLALRTLPFVAIIPILVIVMGTGYEPRITICAIGSFFVTLVNMMRGLRSADIEVDELMHTLGASGLQRLVKVRLFASLPYLMAALKVAASTCVVEATVAEWIAGNSGLGYLVQVSGYTFQLDLMWAAICVAAALTLGLVAVITLVERRATPWVPRSVSA